MSMALVWGVSLHYIWRTVKPFSGIIQGTDASKLYDKPSGTRIHSHFAMRNKVKSGAEMFNGRKIYDFRCYDDKGSENITSALRTQKELCSVLSYRRPCSHGQSASTANLSIIHKRRSSLWKMNQIFPVYIMPVTPKWNMRRGHA